MQNNNNFIFTAPNIPTSRCIYKITLCNVPTTRFGPTLKKGSSALILPRSNNRVDLLQHKRSIQTFYQEPSTDQYISPPGSSWAWLSEVFRVPLTTNVTISQRWVGHDAWSVFEVTFYCMQPHTHKFPSTSGSETQPFEFPFLSKLCLRNAKTPNTLQNLHLFLLIVHSSSHVLSHFSKLSLFQPQKLLFFLISTIHL